MVRTRIWHVTEMRIRTPSLLFGTTLQLLLLREKGIHSCPQFQRRAVLHPA